MKLIIDIDEKMYQELMKEKDFIVNTAKNPYKTVIVNGTPIDNNTENNSN